MLTFTWWSAYLSNMLTLTYWLAFLLFMITLTWWSAFLSFMITLTYWSAFLLFMLTLTYWSAFLVFPRWSYMFPMGLLINLCMDPNVNVKIYDEKNITEAYMITII